MTKEYRNGTFVMVDSEMSVMLAKEEKTDNVHVYGSAVLIQSLIKKQIIKVVSNQVTNFEDDVIKVMQDLWDKAYSKGLADMDKMHGKL